MAQPTHGISEKQISQSLLDLIESGKPTDYATIVYFNSTNPTTATIFDNVNPPVTNDPLLEDNVANLYIGTDNSTWVYNGTNYSTKVVPASSNFYINGTNTDAGNNKTSAISRTGPISVDSDEEIAIYGEGTVAGVYGFCDSSGDAGVHGDGVDTGGVWGSSDTHFGVFGTSDSGIGVQGYSNGSVAGEFGISTLNTGKIATFKKGGTEVASIDGEGNFEGNSFNGFQGFSTLASDLLSKLPKGTYTGTASDLEASILAISTGVQGVAITPTSTPTGTGVASWLVAESGTYTNFGGVILPVNHIGFIIRSVSNVYSITSMELDLSLYAKLSDLPQYVDYSTNVTYPTNAFSLMTNTGGDLAGAGYVNKDFELTEKSVLKSITIKSNGTSTATVRCITIVGSVVTILKQYTPITLLTGENTYNITDDFEMPIGSYLYVQASSLYFYSAGAGSSYRVSGGATDSSVRTSYYFNVYTYSLSQDILTKKIADTLYETINNHILLWGDSITWGAGVTSPSFTWSNVLRNLLINNSYKESVVNCGVGGENFQNILVRQGACGLSIINDVVIPADSTQNIVVQTATNYINDKKLINSYFKTDSYFVLLEQGQTGYDNNKPEFYTVNPIFCENRELVMTYVGNSQNNTIRLSHKTTQASSFTIKAGTSLFLNGNKFKGKVNIISIGTNGGFFIYESSILNITKSVERYVELVSIAIDKANSNCIICTPYGGTALNTLGVSGLIELEDAVSKKFGARHFNWRTYLIDYGLSDAGIAPTATDLSEMALGKVPPSLMADGLHPNDAGHNIIGNRMFFVLKQLGFIELK